MFPPQHILVLLPGPGAVTFVERTGCPLRMQLRTVRSGITQSQRCPREESLVGTRAPSQEGPWLRAGRNSRRRPDEVTVEKRVLLREAPAGEATPWTEWRALLTREGREPQPSLEAELTLLVVSVDSCWGNTEWEPSGLSLTPTRHSLWPCLSP